MELPFTIGLVGSAILIIGSALSVHPVSHPAKSLKNWLFTLGSAFMLGYAVLNYFDGGSFFFILLQSLIAITTVLMMLNTDDRFDIPLISVAAAGLALYSLYLFEGVQTVFFVIGLSVLGIGFALNTGTYKRNMALGVGSAIIGGFSYMEADWIFFGLNFFFAVFSFFHCWKLKTA